jgi:phosphatidylserine/phosphatidylglycerophosphate/cardiolipin synthase-like enzyme
MQIIAMDKKKNNQKSMLSDATLFRTSGASLVSGNRLHILRDGKENYPEWEAAIRSAKRTIHLEMYIIHNDSTGRHFRDLLVAKSREGIQVRVLYDWFGSRSIIGRKMWGPLVEAGGEARSANPPKMSGLLGWLRRDHRKLLAVDGSVAFVSGLCIGDAWVGDVKAGVLPWRDTGLKIKGPAVADAEDAFADAWRISGGYIDETSLPRREDIGNEGDVDVRVVAASPETAGLYRLDLLVAASAQEYLWLTDAYFLGTSAYIQALRSAAIDGIDVRLLVPQSSDIQWIANLSRASYRSLLEAGVRVYEWNGTMVHAKTAVCDGLWARIGSTNLNLSSWLGNWELDVVIENQEVAGRVAAMFLEDLENSTEVVITERNKVRPVIRRRRTRRARIIHSSGQSMLTKAITAGSALNAAVTGKRRLSKSESWPLFSIGLALCTIALGVVMLPSVFSYSFAAGLTVTGIYLLGKAVRLKFSRQKNEQSGKDD